MYSPTLLALLKTGTLVRLCGERHITISLSRLTTTGTLKSNPIPVVFSSSFRDERVYLSQRLHLFGANLSYINLKNIY